MAWLPTLGVVLLLAGCNSPKAQSAGASPAVPVTASVAAQEAVPLELRAVGNVEASATIQVKSQIAGELLRVRFVEGRNVRKGDLLFEIDSRPYREALRQAEAVLARDRAQLLQAEANLARDLAESRNADADAARYEALAKQGVVSRAQHDQSRTRAEALQESIRADKAAIESARASVESDNAAVEKAKLDLSYCEIRSPVSGRAGMLLIHAGNLVKANGDNPLVIINQMTPILVTFSVPERHLAEIREHSRAQKLPVRVSLQNDPGKTARGFLTIVDNAVDTSTGTILLKAAFNNEEGLLWPGQFVNVVVTLDTQTHATVVPSEAVQVGQQGQFIYVVRPDQTVEPRNVTVGRTFNNKVIVEKGIAPGETVVTDGQLRLFPGARVQVVPATRVDSGAL